MNKDNTNKDNTGRGSTLPTSIIAIMLLAIVFSVSIAIADPIPAALTAISTATRDVNSTIVANISAVGGNVTELNIESLTITTFWQGYYGNVTGQVVLDDAVGNRFYNWTTATIAGEVYASRNQTIDWDDLNCSNVTDRAEEEFDINMVASDADSITNTYNSTTHPAITVAGRTIAANTCYSTYGYQRNVSGALANFTMVLLNSVNDTVYTTIINDSIMGFNGNVYDYELLVAEDEAAGVTPFYFWVELD